MTWTRVKLAAMRHLEDAKTMAEWQFWNSVYFAAMSLPWSNNDSSN